MVQEIENYRVGRRYGLEMINGVLLDVGDVFVMFFNKLWVLLIKDLENTNRMSIYSASIRMHTINNNKG